MAIICYLYSTFVLPKGQDRSPQRPGYKFRLPPVFFKREQINFSPHFLPKAPRLRVAHPYSAGPSIEPVRQAHLKVIEHIMLGGGLQALMA